MCRDDNGGCRNRSGVALAGVCFGCVEEGTHVYFTILFWEISQQDAVVFKEAEKHLPNTPEKAYANSEELFFKSESCRLHCTRPV